MVKVICDTSILVAAALPEHPKHSVALPIVNQIHQRQMEGFLSNHTIAEFYSVITRMPRLVKLTPADAQVFLAAHFQHFTCINLTTDDYQAVITRLLNLNLPGGVVFDALIAQAALKAQAEQILTLNPKDFKRLGEEISQLVIEL